MEKFLRRLILLTVAITLLFVWQVESFADSHFGIASDANVKRLPEQNAGSIVGVPDDEPTKYTITLKGEAKATKLYLGRQGYNEKNSNIDINFPFIIDPPPQHRCELTIRKVEINKDFDVTQGIEARVIAGLGDINGHVEDLAKITGIQLDTGVAFPSWFSMVADVSKNYLRSDGSMTESLIQDFPVQLGEKSGGGHITANFYMQCKSRTTDQSDITASVSAKGQITLIVEITDVPIPTATAPYVSTNPIVDGNLSESAWNIATDISKILSGTTDNKAQFGVLWDSTYLYVGVKVLDNNLFNDSRSMGKELFDDDSVEIAIDPDLSRGKTYDCYDRYFLTGWNNDDLDGCNANGVLHGWANISGGYSIEMAIPWTNLGITPTADMRIGFSVGYNDDRDGGVQDAHVVWSGTGGNYTDTSLLGDIVLGKAPTPIPQTVNNLVTFDPIPSTYKTTSDTTGCGDGFVGQFSFDATLTNKSNSGFSLSDLMVKVLDLTNGNLLQNADGGARGVGALLPVPKEGDYAEGILSPGESVDVHFIICLTNSNPFRFVVDVLGFKEAVSSQALEAPQSTGTEPVRAKLHKKGFFGKFRPKKYILDTE